MPTNPKSIFDNPVNFGVCPDICPARSLVAIIFGTTTPVRKNEALMHEIAAQSVTDIARICPSYSECVPKELVRHATVDRWRWRRRRCG